ncbi:unnamed protein product, partial [Rotaria sp. Silwood1]
VPRTSADQRVWYKTIRAGRHRLDLLLQQAMQKAGINGKFSCMSLRKGKIKAHQHHHQQQQLSSTLNNHKRTASSTSNSSYSELLDLSSHSNNNNKNNNNNGVINLAKKIKRESTPPSLLLSMPCSLLTNFNYQQRPLVTADDLPSLVAQTPTSILISSANNNNKCKLTSHDNTFTALYSAAHSKSSRQSKMNVCTPIEHYE